MKNLLKTTLPFIFLLNSSYAINFGELHAVNVDSKGNFIVVGDDQFIASSKDGINWQQQSSYNSTISLDAVTTNQNGLSIATGFNNLNQGIIESGLNADNWQMASDNFSSINAITSASDNSFYAVGNYSTLLHGSSDGNNWQKIILPTGNYDLNAITITPKQEIVAIGYDYDHAAPIIFYSSNTKQWRLIRENTLMGVHVKSVISNKNGFLVAVATVNDGNNAQTILTSADGINWTIVSNPNLNLTSVAVNAAGLFVAVGSRGSDEITQKAITVTSPDGINWTVHDIGWSNGQLNGISVNNDGLFVAIGDGNGQINTNIVTSNDGINWK
jgi:photosystem II stability/assembly factor-like uncharacterized protein